MLHDYGTVNPGLNYVTNCGTVDPGLIMLPDYAMYNVIGTLDPWLNYAT